MSNAAIRIDVNFSIWHFNAAWRRKVDFLPQPGIDPKIVCKKSQFVKKTSYQPSLRAQMPVYQLE